MKFKRILGFIGLLVAAEFWLRFFWPPFGRYFAASDKSIWPVVIDLLRYDSPIYPGIPFGGWLFLVLLPPLFAIIIIVSLLLISYFEKSYCPISVLQTKLELTFDKPDLSVSRLTRTQLFCANREQQSAYHFRTSSNSQFGEIARSQFKMYSKINGDTISMPDSPIQFGNIKAMELIERFSKPLPHNPIISLFPNSWILSAYKYGLLGALIVKRHGETVFLNEYNGPEGQLTLTSLRYPVTNAEICIEFPSDVAPIEGDIQAWLTKENTAKQLDLDQKEKDGKIIYAVSVENLIQSSIRIWWKNKRLCEKLTT